MGTYLIIHMGPEVHVWDLGDAGVDQLERLVFAARISLDIPPAVTGFPGDSGVVVMVTQGEPHHTLMARAKVGTAEDLAAVDPAAVSAYQTARADAHRDVQLEAARAALADLDPAALAALLEHPDVAAKLDGKA